MAMPQTSLDSIEIMNRLAEMLGMKEAGLRRMVIILDVEDIPRIFTQGLIRSTNPNCVQDAMAGIPCDVADVGDTPLLVSENGDVVDIDTTTMKNFKWRTKTPKPSGGK
jgi:hypothetical protein